jgi:hypothetical protein
MPSTTPGQRYWALRASVSDAPLMSYGRMSCVMSITVTWGAIERITDLTTPTNSSPVP